jgi:[ribosomal protein S18]-alanine N-acetyltransferase
VLIEAADQQPQSLEALPRFLLGFLPGERTDWLVWVTITSRARRRPVETVAGINPSAAVRAPSRRSGTLQSGTRVRRGQFPFDTPTVRTLRIRPFTAVEARLAAGWRYEPPLDIYDSDQDDGGMFLLRTEEGYGYYAIVDADSDEELIGFCCFGPEARVKGQVEKAGSLDIGGGIRPDLVSQGIATSVFPSILDFGMKTFRRHRFRTAVASCNERSIRLCRSAGFEVVRKFEGPGREFQELLRVAL